MFEATPNYGGFSVWVEFRDEKCMGDRPSALWHWLMHELEYLEITPGMRYFFFFLDIWYIRPFLGSYHSRGLGGTV